MIGQPGDLPPLSSPSPSRSHATSENSFPVGPAALCEAIERQVALRTHGRVQHLRVALEGGRVVLTGLSPSYYVKQLTVEGALDVLQGVADAPGLEVRLQVGDTSPD